MELEIRELPSPEERSRQLNHMQSFKAELKRLEREYRLIIFRNFLVFIKYIMKEFELKFYMKVE